jgi:phage terminase Nu1 subunit (DNA packaging protein)
MTTAPATTHTLEQAAALLGKKPHTLKAWFLKGCPHEKTGRATGGYRVNIAAVFDWRILHEKSLAAGLNGEAIPSVELERALLARSQREAVEMANAVRRGELVEASGVLREWQAMIAACRAKLLSLGDKLAARLPIPDNTRKKVAAAIRDGIAEGLKELANDRA